MPTSLRAPLAWTVLATAFAVRAFGHLEIPCAIFRTQRVEYTMTLRDQDNRALTVHWVSDTPGIYRVQITRAADANEKLPISLYTLGLQGRLRDGLIIAASSAQGKIEILDAHGVPPAWLPADGRLPWEIPALNPPPERPQKWNDRPALVGNVWFLKFKGTSCTLTLQIAGNGQVAGLPIPFVTARDHAENPGAGAEPPRNPPEP